MTPMAICIFWPIAVTWIWTKLSSWNQELLCSRQILAACKIHSVDGKFVAREFRASLKVLSPKSLSILLRPYFCILLPCPLCLRKRRLQGPCFWILLCYDFLISPAILRNNVMIF